MSQLLTLTTDFGTEDAYVAAMKGVVLGIAPAARLVDVTHTIAPQDTMEAAWILRQTVPFFPQGTVHLAVVDPGVGTERRAIACRIGGHTFVGPDNGLFSLLLGEDALGPDLPDEVVELTDSAYWRIPEPSRTFHGRDIFAPVAAHLVSGRRLQEVGTPVSPDSLVRRHWVRPRADAQGVQGWVVHVDRFGNAITNIPGALVYAHGEGREIRGYAGSAILSGLCQTYGDVEAGEPLLLVGSSGHVEVGVNGGHAADLLSLPKGSPVQLVFTEPR